MWIGVLSGLAVLKFSGSPIKKGANSAKRRVAMVRITSVGISFDEKNG
jgi:hypothetical protein